MFQEQIKILRQIQHLTLIRDEDANVGAGKQGEALSAKMEGLVARLDAEALAAALAKEKVIADANAVVSAALEREKILTTAVGHGLAFPHMRGVEEGVLTFACGVSPAGIDWNGELVRLVFFTTLPVVASPFYLKLLAAICKTFEDEEKLPFVLAAGDAKTLWKELNKATRVAVKNM